MFAFMLTAYRSGSGKTVLSAAIARALTNIGATVRGFKCGPDYIDPIFMSHATGMPSYNLDEVISHDIRAELAHGVSDNITGAVVEGVMGFFDGLDPASFYGSSYSVAKSLDLPAVLIVDAKGMGATAAAIVLGVKELAKGVKICGVILNNVSSSRHSDSVKKAMAAHVPDIPIIGIIPKIDALSVLSARYGLDTSSTAFQTRLEDAAAEVSKYIDLKFLMSLHYDVTTLNPTCNKINNTVNKIASVAYDNAFNFYYQSTFDCLERLGYQVVKFSPLNDEVPYPKSDLIMLGGGHVERYADQLALCHNTRKNIMQHFQNGVRIVGEGGGFVYMTNSLQSGDKLYPLLGIFDIDNVVSDKRQGLGYVQWSNGRRGHMFHYTTISADRELPIDTWSKMSDNTVTGGMYKKINATGSFVHHMYSNDDDF